MAKTGWKLIPRVYWVHALADQIFTSLEWWGVESQQLEVS